MTTSQHLMDYLEDLVQHYNKREFIHTDPIGFIHTIEGNANRELTAFTEQLREFDPEDPVKYDFALTRMGMLSKNGAYHTSTKSMPSLPSG